MDLRTDLWTKIQGRCEAGLHAEFFIRRTGLGLKLLDAVCEMFVEYISLLFKSATFFGYVAIVTDTDGSAGLPCSEFVQCLEDEIDIESRVVECHLD
jgi:hypothetical protein